MMFSYWVQIWKEEKKSRELELQMQAMQDRMNGLNGRQKGNAVSVQQRVNDQMATNLLLNTFSYWLMATKTSRVEQYFTSKWRADGNSWPPCGTCSRASLRSWRPASLGPTATRP